MATDRFGLVVDDKRWQLVDKEIGDFVRKYPLHWKMFKSDLAAERTEYQLAKEGDLKEAGFRNSMSLPTIQRKRTQLEREADFQNEDDYTETDSLYQRLMPLLPGLTDPDKDGKPNTLYKEFLRRYPVFIPGNKL